MIFARYVESRRLHLPAILGSEAVAGFERELHLGQLADTWRIRLAAQEPSWWERDSRVRRAFSTLRNSTWPIDFSAPSRAIVGPRIAAPSPPLPPSDTRVLRPKATSNHLSSELHEVYLFHFVLVEDGV